MLGTSPEWQEVVQTPWEFISAVSIDGLEEAEDDPDVHREDVKVASGENPKDGHHDGAESENQHFNWRCVLSGETEWRRILVMNLVDVLVKGAPMHSAMKPVVPCILQHEKDGNLEGHLRQAWERHAKIHATVFCHWVKEPDLWQFDGEMIDEDPFCAIPLLGSRWDLVLLNLVFLEIGELRHDNPGETATKVDDFVHHETHDSSGQNIILYVGIPALQKLVVSQGIP